MKHTARIPIALALPLLLAATIATTHAQSVPNNSATPGSASPASSAQNQTPAKPIPVTTSPASASASTRAIDATTPPSDDDIVYLNRFEVSSEANRGYYATQTLAGSRINTKLEDVGSAITVVTPEFLRDTGAVDNQSLLSYTPNTEVSGMLGNMRGASAGADQDQSGSFTNPNGNTRVRGLTAADATRNFFRSSIPWDGYNVDRVEIQRGPSAILFGLGSPAGIINETSKTAQHKNYGTFEARFGSYDSTRVSLDWNQNLLKNELSMRVNLMRNDYEYRQDPAYSIDRRIALSARYDPRWANNDKMKTTLKLNFESGSIKSNNPRTITPADLVTQWWSSGSGMMNHQGYNPQLVLNSNPFYTDGANGYYKYQNADQSLNQGQRNRLWVSATGVPLPNNSSNNPNYTPWLNDLTGMAGGMWIVTNSGQVVPSSGMLPETNTFPYSVNTSGATELGAIAGIPYSRRVTVASRSFWGNGTNATEAEGAKYGKYGVWKTDTLKDASIFDFYNNLLDGDNKQEWQSFNDFSAFLNQSFFDNQIGYELAYDHQNMTRGQYSFDGGGVIYVDINKNNIDGTPNEHFGQPYIQSNYRYGNNATDIALDSARFTAFIDHNFDKGTHRNWLTKLLGRHTITGLVSTETYKTDTRDFSRYALGDDAIGLMSTVTNIDNAARQLTSTVYLGSSLANATTYKGARIPNATGQVQIPGSIPWTYFDSHWTAPTSVNPASAWINTYNGATSTQSENPANYAGWKTANVSILSAENGDQDQLTRQGRLNKRRVSSMAVSWQAYFWDESLVALYGVRQDHVETWGLASDTNTTYGNINLNTYNFSNPNTRTPVFTDNTSSWSMVAKLNQILRGKLPVNINLYYNQSDNFQVPDAITNDIYGNAIPPPTGSTKEMGVLLSTKDQRFVLKVNKYDTRQKNVVNNSGLATWYFFDGSSSPDNNFIGRGENRIDQFEYHMTARPSDGGKITYLDAAQPAGVAPWSFGQSTSSNNGATYTETQQHSDTTRMAVVAAWRAFTAEPFVQNVLNAWGYDLNGSTGGGYAKTPVANFGASRDQISKGWEVEFTANPTKNWRINLNASYTKASISNVGGAAFNEFVSAANAYFNRRLVPVAADTPGAMTAYDGRYSDGRNGQAYSFRWATDAEIAADRAATGPDGKPLLDSKGTGNDLFNQTFAGIGGYNMWNYPGARNGGNVSWNSNFYSSYSLLKLLEGTYNTELRPWRVNIITSYDFTTGGLKGLTIGGGYRWQDKNIIGYPVIFQPIEPGVRSQESITYDVDHPYYGPSLSSFDFWVGYQVKLSPKLTWRIQLNVRDAFSGKKLIPLTTQYDGTVAAWGIAPSRTWMITNTLSF